VASDWERPGCSVISARQGNRNRWAAANTFLTAAPLLVRVLGAAEVLPLLVGFMTEWRQANDVWRLRQALLYCVPGLIAFGETELAAELLGAVAPEAQRPGAVLRGQLATELSSRIGEAGLDRLTNLGRQAPTQTLADRAIDAINRHS